MIEIMAQDVQINDLKEVVNALTPDSIKKDTEKACQSVYPLCDVFVRKVKTPKQPNFESGKLMALCGEDSSSGKATGVRPVRKLNKPADMSHQSKICLKLRHVMVTNEKISFVIFNFWFFFWSNLSLVNQMFWTDGDMKFSELVYGFHPLLLTY